MPTASDFARQGYLLLPEFVAPPDLAALRQEVDNVLSLSLAEGCERPNNTLAPLSWADPVLDIVLGNDRRVGRLRHAIKASDLRWISGYVSSKEAGSGALWWHQDWWCWQHPVSFLPPAPQIALLCYLSQTSVEAGALRLLPGSHRQSIPLHRALPQAHAADADELDPQHPAMVDQPRQVTVEAQPGDAVVLDYRVLHGTHPNLESSRRDCILLSFAPAWSELPPEIRGHLIQHPAQPNDPYDNRGSYLRGLLPSFDGPRGDLELDRSAPARFEIAPSPADSDARKLRPL